MITSINGNEHPWPPEIEQLWHTHVDQADPKFLNTTITRANYFTPRPYVDEYNQGSNKAGFTYVVHTTGSAGVDSVWQCSWFEDWDPAKHEHYRHLGWSASRP